MHSLDNGTHAASHASELWPQCAGIMDIQEALKYAKAHGLEVAVRGGGHAVVSGSHPVVSKKCSTDQQC